jgi:hypothetical protein
MNSGMTDKLQEGECDTEEETLASRGNGQWVFLQRAILPQVLARSYSIIRNEQADGQMRRANSREPAAA